MDTALAELELFEAAIDRFSQQPVPREGPALATYVARVQRANDKIALKVAEGAAAFAQTDELILRQPSSPRGC